MGCIYDFTGLISRPQSMLYNIEGEKKTERSRVQSARVEKRRKVKKKKKKENRGNDVNFVGPASSNLTVEFKEQPSTLSAPRDTVWETL